MRSLVLVIYFLLLILVLYLLYAKPSAFGLPDFAPLEQSPREKLEPAKDDVDYALQPWVDKASDDTWHRAHDFMYDILSKNVYITFDLRHTADPKYVYIPGKLTKFNCRDLAKALPKIKKVWKQNLADLQEIVKKRNNGVIRASGGHHTFNDISVTDDTIIRTFNLKNVLNIDEQQKTVTVESGILLGEINLCLLQRGLALHVLPAIPFQSLGGALSTSSHGSRWTMGSMASAILEITLVLADGSVRTFTRKDPEFTAVQVNLGCLGVVHSYKLQCVDLFAVEHTRKKMLWPEILENLDQYLQEYIFFQCYIRPETEDLSTTVYLRKMVNPADYSKKELEKDRGTNVRKLDKKVDYGMYVLTKNQEASHYTEMEIAVPGNVFREAVSDTINLIQDYEKNYDWKYNRSILIRFTAADTGLLSMTSGRDSVFINIFQSAKEIKNSIVLSLFRDFQRILTEKYLGRPHWGKYNEMTPELTERVYGKANFEQFNRVRKQLDPKGVFSNAYVIRALGDV